MENLTVVNVSCGEKVGRIQEKIIFSEKVNGKERQSIKIDLLRKMERESFEC